MKKSEAVQMLTDNFMGLFDQYFTKQYVVDILDFCINELGLLPPSYIHYTDQDNGNTLCSERCEWEPENETK